jgi:hypothetical protein
MFECGDRMTLHRYSVSVDLIVKGFAEGDCISAIILGSGTLAAVRGKPKVDAVELCYVCNYVTVSPRL